MSTFRKNLITKRSMSMRTLPIQSNNYNNYYIDPELRYKEKSKDPKKNMKVLENQNYVYEKLHD